jgi:hypothetical protein
MCGGHRKFGVKFKAFSQSLADVPTAMEKNRMQRHVRLVLGISD